MPNKPHKKIVTHRMLEAFRAAVMHGGITAGADALGIPQPSMSRIITDLQKIVGFALFQKKGRNVLPTEEALMLMVKVRQSFIGLEEVVAFSEQLQKQKTGRLSICAVPSIGHSMMPEIIKRLREEFPDTLFSLSVASYIEVAQNVRNRRADIGLTANALSIGALETVAEFSSNCVCIGSSRWLDQVSDSITVKDLQGLPFIAPMGTFGRDLESIFSSCDVEVDTVVEASLFHTISDLVLQGMGVSIVDPFTGRSHRRRGGVCISLSPSIPYTVYATAMGDTRLGKAAQELIRHLTEATSNAAKHTKNE